MTTEKFHEHNRDHEAEAFEFRMQVIRAAHAKIDAAISANDELLTTQEKQDTTLTDRYVVRPSENAEAPLPHFRIILRPQMPGAALHGVKSMRMIVPRVPVETEHGPDEKMTNDALISVYMLDGTVTHRLLTPKGYQEYTRVDDLMLDLPELTLDTFAQEADGFMQELYGNVLAVRPERTAGNPYLDMLQLETDLEVLQGYKLGTQDNIPRADAA